MARIPLRAYEREIADLIDHDQFDEAIAHCKHILIFFSKHIDTYRLLGKAYLESQRYGDAADVFQRVLSSLPEDFVAHLGMSVIREDEGNLDEAIWHMERAFEMQPANATVQGELRRLLGRRDGLEPPKIRLTRGALARMYVKGDLYPQAAAELRAALAEDPQRLDLLTLLARTYFLVGQKAEAAETSSALLRKLPNSLEANLLLSQILAGSERAAEAESYRQRVQELDPYTAYTSPEVTSPEAPSPDKVQESQVTIERLDWKPGQPATGTGAQPEWAESLGLNPKEMAGEEPVPEWLSNLTGDTVGPETGDDEARKTVPSGVQSESQADFGAEVFPAADAFPAETPESTSPPASGEIPGWMAAVGWAAASGQEEESGSVPAFEEDTPAEEIAPTEIPDWLRSMAPSAAEEAAPDLPGDQEEQPPVSEPPQPGPFTKEFLPWLSETQPGPTDSILNWLEDKTPPSGIDTGPAEPGSPDETEETAIPDWIQGLGEGKGADVEYFNQEESDAPIDLPDWLTGSEPDEAGSEIPDWLKGMADQPETASGPEAEDQSTADGSTGQPPPAEQPAIEESQAWGAETEDLPAAAELESQPSAGDQPEEETPDWLKAVGLGAVLSAATDEGGSAETQPAGAESEEGAFDWLEGLADRQGAGAAIFPTSEEPLESGLDWMVEETSAGEGQSPAVENEAEIPHAELPEWLQGLAPTTPLEPAGSDLGTVGVFPFARSEEPASSAEPADIPEWLQGITSEGEGTSEAIDGGTGWPEKLDEGPISEEDTKPTRVSQAMAVSIPPELSEFVAETAPEPAETQAPLEASWETAQEPASETPAEESSAQRPEEVPPAAEAAVEAGAGEQDAAFDWLDNLGSPQAEEPAEPTGKGIAAAVIGAQIFKASHAEEPVDEMAVEEEEAAAPAPLDEWTGDEGQTERPEEAYEPAAINPAEIETPALESSEAAAVEEMEAKPEAEPVLEDETTAEGEFQLPAWLYEEGGEAEIERPAEAAAELEGPEEPQIEIPAEKPDEMPAELVDLNRATLIDLERVPGIGLLGAQAILAYRESQGELSTLEDLQNVPGFDEETILQLRDRVTVIPPEAAGTAETPVDWSQMALIQARNAVAQSSPEEAFENYSGLIKSRTLLPEVIQDLHEALYRFPENVPLLQALGDAYARNDQLQEALDTYIKAEELLR